MLSRLMAALRALLRRPEVERESDEELHHHIEQQTEQNIRLGMNPDEARYAARKAFGGVEQAKERSRDARGVRWLEDLWQDLRFGGRMLLKEPGFTLVAVTTLALGIGANTAIFSVVNAVLLRPLPYPEPEQLLLVQQNMLKLGMFYGGVSAAEWLDYQAGNEAFAEIAGHRLVSLNLTGRGEAQRVQGARISASLFPLLGIQPLVGRAFSTGEDRYGQHQVVVLSERLWRRKFGGDAKIVGQTVKLNDNPYTIVGVMPGSLQFPYTGTSFAEAVELWVPLALSDQERGGRVNDTNYGIVGRLKPGVSIAQAQANMAAVAARFQQQHPESYKNNLERSVIVVGLAEKTVQRVRPFILMLLAAVGLVLLASCANIANLQLARAAARRREMAIRSAVGASAHRLVRQLLTENLLLAGLGGGVGLLLAVWAVDLIARFGPEDVPRLQQVRLDPLVLSFTVLATLLTGILCGLAPSLQAARLDLNDTLKESGGRASRGGEGRLRAALVVFEVAAAFVLLIGGGLLIHSFVRLLRQPPGFDPLGVVIARTALPVARYPKTEQSRVVHQRVLEKMAALPGVRAVAVASNLPLTGETTIGLRLEGDTEGGFKLASLTQVSNDYFRAMGISLRQGRVFTAEDREGSPLVAVVNETMARSYWPGQAAIGKRIKWGDRDWMAIIGVVADVKLSSLEAEDKPAVYLPMFQAPGTRPNAIYVARTTVEPASLIASLRREIRAVDEELAIYDVRTMNQVLAESVAQRRFSTSLLTGFAAAALLLAAVGLYGVTAYAVTQRTQEIGIRMALGAQTDDVLRLVAGQVIKLVALGVVLGLVGALAATRLLKSLLFGVSATDPLTFAMITLLLTAIGLLACWIPARRATKVDPLVALRTE